MKVYDVFISYRRKGGKRAAVKLYKFLKGLGVKVFFDTEAIVDGHRWTTQIRDNLIAATHYILVGSKSAFAFRKGEDWVREEIKLALAHYDKKTKNRTITVWIPDGSALPNAESLPKDVRTVLEYNAVFGTTKEAFDRLQAAVTAVSHANLWHAAYRWLQRSKLPGGRFEGAQVDESLLPCARGELPMCVLQEQYGRQELLEAVKTSHSHMYLIGQGGMGKTTALLKLMQDAYENREYDRNNVVPIFVELSSAPDTFGRLYQGGSSSFIRRAIYRQLRPDRSLKQVSMAAVEKLDEVFTLPYQTAVEPIDDLLGKDSDRPEYLLLLDGLNEVSTVMVEKAGRTVSEMIVDEIRFLMHNCPNVRLVLTSRSDELALRDTRFTRLELTGLDESSITDYLQRRGGDVSQPLFLDSNILQTLQIPLFLILYAELTRKEGICTQGQILHCFFSRSQTQSYTMRTRLDAVAESTQKSASAKSKIRIEPDMHCFILDFILPEIGWFMEKNGLFHISQRKLNHIIWQVLEDRSEKAVCGEFGEDVFKQYHRFSSVRSNTATVADKLIARLGGVRQVRTICERIVNCCNFSLGVLKETDGKYSFSHQHIRDYFAAKKYINTLQLATYMHSEEEPELAYDCAAAVLGETPLSLTVRRFIGEALAEHQNAPVLRNGQYTLPAMEGQQRLLTDALAVFRGKDGTATAALIHILKDVRRVLAGMDLSRLDLTQCDLSGAKLCLPGLSADLTGARIAGECLLHTGHSGWISTVRHTQGHLLTGGSDGKVLLHHSQTGIRRELVKLEGSVWFADLLRDGRLLTVSENSFRNVHYGVCNGFQVGLTDLNDPDTRQQLEFTETPGHVRLSQDESRLLILLQDACLVIDVENMALARRIPVPENNLTAEFFGNTHEILLSDGTIVHADTGKKRKLPGKQYIHRAAFSGQDMCTMEVEHNSMKLAVFRGNTRIHTMEQFWEGYKLRVNVLNYQINRFLHVKYSQSGRFLIAIVPDHTYIYETGQYRLVHCLEYAGIDDVAFFDEDSRLAVGTMEGQLIVYETVGFTPVLHSESIGCEVTAMVISRGGKYLATCSNDGCLRLWDMESLRLLAQKQIGCSFATKPYFTNGDKLLAFEHFRQDGETVWFKVPSLEKGRKPASRPHTGYWVQKEYPHYHEARVFHGKEQLFTIYDCMEYRMAGMLLFVRVGEPVSSRQCWQCYDITTGALMWQLPAGLELLCADERFFVAQQENPDTWNDPEEKVIMLYDCRSGKCLARTGYQSGYTNIWQLHGNRLLRNGMSDATLFRLPELSVEREFSGQVVFHGKWLYCEADNDMSKLNLCLYRADNVEPCATFSVPVLIPVVSNLSSSYLPLGDDRLLCLDMYRQQLCLYGLQEPGQPCEALGKLTMEPGLDVIGLDLTRLHPDSRFTPEQALRLRQYGALL